MRNVLRVLARDFVRLVKTPAAMLVVVFLMLLPSLYTWFNVVGFWNPYENTGNLRVCVANDDGGVVDEKLGELDLGSRIVDSLADNKQLGWDFTTREAALEAVRSGAAYAAFVIPADFSANVASLVSGDINRPKLEYYVNEKVGPVAPKITDTGANTLDTTINETFVSVVSATLVDALEDKLDEAKGRALSTQSKASKRLEKVKAGLANARSELGELASAAREGSGEARAAKDSLSNARDRIAQASAGLDQTSQRAARASASLVAYSSALSTVLDNVSRAISKTMTKSNASIGKVTNAVAATTGKVDAAIARAKAVEDEGERIAGLLRDAAGEMPDGSVKDELNGIATSLDAANLKVSNELDALEQLSADTLQASKSTAAAAQSIDAATSEALARSDEFRSSLGKSMVPALSESLAQTASVTGNLSSAIAGQTLLVKQAGTALDQLATTLEDAAWAIDKTDGIIGGIQDDLDTLGADLAALGAAAPLSERLGLDKISADAVADFMMSPTQVKTEELYPLNAYGSAMAPLFLNLTLWIGVFMLMVIFRLEVDDEGIKGLTITQRHFSRVLFFVPIVAAQAVICCAGCLVLGVQCANAPAFFLTAIIASITYLSIQYTLSTTMQHVGKALCIILVFVQIPAATGLYPIEMTPAFFTTVYPMFPFTYGINAIRETIGGFADGLWLRNIGALLGFLAVFTVAGAVARPLFANLNRLFAREIEESDIVNVEAVELPARRYRTTQLIRALTEHDEYRTELEKRVAQFIGLYPKLKAAALIAGIAVPVISTAILSFAHFDRVITLTTWLVWLLAVISFLIVIEYIRDSLAHQMSLESMSEDELRSIYSTRNAFTRLSARKASAHAQTAQKKARGGQGEASVAEGVGASDAPSEETSVAVSEQVRDESCSAGSGDSGEADGPGEADDLEEAGDRDGSSSSDDNAEDGPEGKACDEPCDGQSDGQELAPRSEEADR